MTVLTIHDKRGSYSITLYGSMSVVFHEGRMLVACGDGKTRGYPLREIDYVEVEEGGK